MDSVFVICKGFIISLVEMVENLDNGIKLEEESVVVWSEKGRKYSFFDRLGYRIVMSGWWIDMVSVFFCLNVY